MENSGITNFTKNTFGPMLYPNNLFDQNFLKEKESALSPIFLDDTIPIQTNSSINLLLDKPNSKSIIDKNKLSITSDLIYEKRSKLSSKKNSIGSYGSNIVLISTNKEEDSKEGLIIEDINKLLKDPKNLKIKKPIRKRRYLK